MSFVNVLDQLPAAKSSLLRRFATLLEPNDDAQLERMAQEARRLTRRNFGRTMRMFAPLYLSNECINNCRYCGFSRDNPILRASGAGWNAAGMHHLDAHEVASGRWVAAVDGWFAATSTQVRGEA